MIEWYGMYKIKKCTLDQTAAFAAMLASRELLRGLGCNIEAISIKMVVVRSSGACGPNLVGLLAAFALKKLTPDTTEDHGNQHQQRNDKHHEIELQIRCLHGVNGRRGSLVRHAVASWDPRGPPNSRTGGRPSTFTPGAA